MRGPLMFVLLLVSLITACEPPDSLVSDDDRDGHLNDVDCNDDDPTIHPEAVELCDGIDNNCDGQIDEEVGDTFYVDNDLDGYGDADQEIIACEVSEGIASNSLDCNDDDPKINPDAEEICDEIDNDCDDEIDELVTTTYWADGDGDGFGDEDTEVEACELREGIVDNKDDCNDDLTEVNPDADELCIDELDNNCDGQTNEDTAIDAPQWWKDSDFDGFGDKIASLRACEKPVGYVDNDQDCNDESKVAYPDAPEYCDEIDNDCDEVIDEDDSKDARTWFEDSDGDGFGVLTSTKVQCYDPGAEWVEEKGDCRPADADAYPGADEYCDGHDDDCDGKVDEDDALDSVEWYRDYDGDTQGDPKATKDACYKPTGYVDNKNDCNDRDKDTYLGATEYCDGHDDNCDGVVDEDTAVDAKTWYRDWDRDKYGDIAKTTKACRVPSGYVADKTDCDDTEGAVYPGADEYCNSRDDDCDKTIDEDDSVDAKTWYKDGDGDKYGIPSVTKKACSLPTGYADNSTDCDDTKPKVYPGADEYCNGYDDDCDRVVDEADAVDAKSWYYDSDGDGFGSGTVTKRCTAPSSYYKEKDGDCRPSDKNSYPGAPEICFNGTKAEGIDNDCDKLIDEECPTIHCGTISKDETWKKNTYGHVVTCTVQVQGGASPVLTIDKGATVTFRNNTALWIGYSYDGDIEIDGTATERVIFKSDDRTPAAGDYHGLILWSKSAASRISGLDIKHAGGSASYPGAIYLNGAKATIVDSVISDSARSGIHSINSTPSISKTEISNNATYGLYCNDTKCLADTADGFANNTLKGNKSYPIAAYANTIDTLATTSKFSGNTNDYVLVRGGSVVKDATWHNLGVPYRIDNTVHVQHNVNEPILTVEDGVDMRFDSATAMHVGYSYAGDIEIDGHTKGVKMTSFRSRPSKGDWTGLVLNNHVGLDTFVDGLDISYGGYSATWPGNIYVHSASAIVISETTSTNSSRHGLRGASNTPVEITNSTFNDNTEFGVYLDNTAKLNDSFTGNKLTRNGWPMRLASQQTHMLSTGNSFAGNKNDFIQVRNNGYINAHSTWSAMDVPYYAVDSVYVGNTGSGATLTLNDGVDIRFANRVGMWVGYSSYNGDLVVKGDRVKGKGVKFSSFSGTGPGTWYGIMLFSRTSALTKMAGFTLREAGYYSYYQGGIYVENGTAALSDCLIEDNERWGVYAHSSHGTAYSDVEISDCTIQKTATTNKSTKPDGDGLHFNNSRYHQFWMDDVTLTGNARYPVSLSANQMVLMESETGGSDYTGNGTDIAYVYGEYATTKGTWQDLGIPWFIGGNIFIQNTGSKPAHITTTNTDFQFALGTGLFIGYSNYGDLTATGATFTSSRGTPLKGDWCGLYYGPSTSTLSTLKTSTVSYGGKVGGCAYYGDYANVILRYSKASITSDTITNSGKYGVRCWGTGHTLSGNTYSGNTSGNTSGC